MCYYGRTIDAIDFFQSLGIPVAGNPAEVYADALAAQPDRLIEAWEGSAERTMLQKKLEVIHSGAGAINEIITAAQPDRTLAYKVGFYQHAAFRIQFWELLKRQVFIYIRNPTIKTSRLIAGICSALFFGRAYFQLANNTAGFLARCLQGYAYKIMVAGYGSTAVAYWVEKRKQYYAEEAAGYYHRLGHFLVMFFVEWIVLSAVMVSFPGRDRAFFSGFKSSFPQAVIGGIMFPMGLAFAEHRVLHRLHDSRGIRRDCSQLGQRLLCVLHSLRQRDIYGPLLLRRAIRRLLRNRSVSFLPSPVCQGFLAMVFLRSVGLW
jgi:hypothetical protein